MPELSPLKIFALGAPPWPTADPFLFCVHHKDAYPAGTDALGPPADQLAGRPIGSDFSGRDGWSMYHGESVPGFPGHPHRGFETITIVESGWIDHADSLGARARFGAGDVQWLTAGRGIVHSEMFPLLHHDRPNPLELFQIWLNLPRATKMADPHFQMIWHTEVPVVTWGDAGAPIARGRAIAGALPGAPAPTPPPGSWASRQESDLAVWLIDAEPGARWTLPAASSPRAARIAYLYDGDAIEIEGVEVSARHGAALDAARPTLMRNVGERTAQLLVLQGSPIGEPVAQRGPFVMSSQAELRQAMLDYQRTEFGGWPWNDRSPVWGAKRRRFAEHPDGIVEEPGA